MTSLCMKLFSFSYYFLKVDPLKSNKGKLFLFFMDLKYIAKFLFTIAPIFNTYCILTETDF